MTRRIMLILVVFLVSVSACTYEASEKRLEKIRAEAREAFEASKERERQRNQARREAYVEANPDLGELVRESILSGTVRRRMTDEQVIASIGEPSRRNITSGYGYSEQWVYTGGPAYIYFRRDIHGNLIVDSWQTTR